MDLCTDFSGPKAGLCVVAILAILFIGGAIIFAIVKACCCKKKEKDEEEEKGERDAEDAEGEADEAMLPEGPQEPAVAWAGDPDDIPEGGEKVREY
uniref:Uncharacterized protein n=1 Tax=Chromera velia CCMP2878 TaxID=1169474 RepID=A0A0G4F410_9ALVE|mmetsp:Transcript_20978/g.41887  ORF Transcript_20978/g.41887 Transcript_20978/m.41887 type:complete len:96 (+) Transcript_20978:149-436(+)|eukprot:Cvel_15081.t1-p1 / transcript=Cvel_15081.t1 / gene=Cvel_15081 / organism=Chromera_velia_CCMP2878 / gene_product=hypothetical protein / transcript_product=hypothetical protein / location=Cvel_scaffold1100:11923-14191(-) / protein_length=95 / sequence_SO=supercontig / SO=protein_coding / is_pseudo=false